MNVRLRKKVHKIVDLCMDAKDLGHDCFFNTYPHVNQVKIQCFLGEWDKEKEIGFEKHTNLNSDDAVDDLNEMIEYLENLIEESL